MNKRMLIALVILVAGALSASLYFTFLSNPSPAEVEDSTSRLNNQQLADDSITDDESTMEGEEQVGESRYITYSPQAFENAKGTKRVYFFHASWCPTCTAADAQFNANLNRIPEDVTLFKTDYDTQTDLKDRYDITYQHTFVWVDENGNEVDKWNGGDIEELISHTQ